ncbi:MAG: right-handed parallel beta-helix repeat-containing protein [Bacteroidetes bacterium]|nr:right-handed parallel beta-helix repeat-containing protein [Bacteroidota bacterium]
MKSQDLLKHLIFGSIFTLSLLVSCKKDKEENIEKLPCTITTDKVLEDKGDGIDYLASCEVQVTKGTLTVKPGVTIAFETNAGITVREQGALVAEGTVSKPILFTGKNKARGAWMGIFFHSNSVLNKLNYTTVEYAGGSIQTDMDEETAIGVGTTDININEPSRVLITNTTVKESNGYGISIDYNTNITGFANNKLINNDMAGVRLPLGYLGFLDAASDYLTGEWWRIYRCKDW